VVEFQFRDLVSVLASLGHQVLLFPEVTVATKARGPMVVICGTNAYLLTGSIDLLAVAVALAKVLIAGISIQTDIDPKDIQTPEAAQLTDITDALRSMSEQKKIIPRSVRFIPVELKKLGAQLVEKHLAQAFFETAAR
jgi:hypothetical protein